MSLITTRQIVERFVDYDWSVLAPDAIGELIGLNLRRVGPEAIEAEANRLYTVTFDAHTETRRVFVSEEHGACEYDFIGKHIGEFCGIAGTGRRFHVPAISVYDVSGEAITGVRMYLPVSLILDQIRD